MIYIGIWYFYAKFYHFSRNFYYRNISNIFKVRVCFRVIIVDSNSFFFEKSLCI